MNEYYLTFRSVTAAMSGARKLGTVGLKLRPMASPEPLRKKGCGYCLHLDQRQYWAAYDLLPRCGYERIYEKREGQWRELQQ